jgi:hypothetical protein
MAIKVVFEHEDESLREEPLRAWSTSRQADPGDAERDHGPEPDTGKRFTVTVHDETTGETGTGQGATREDALRSAERQMNRPEPMPRPDIPFGPHDKPAREFVYVADLGAVRRS